MDEKVKILRDYARMCKSKANCRSCELFRELGGININCFERILKDTEKAAEIIERWAKGNSEKTYLQDVLEKFPKIERIENGTPHICRKLLYGQGIICDSETLCSYCWNEPMEV